MSKVVIERAVVLQALEAMEAMQSYAASERKGLRICDEAIPALSAALAQQAEPVAERAFLERILAAMEGVIDVADRKTAEFDALRSCVIDLTVMLHAAPPQRKPLTEKEMYAVEEEARKNFRLSQKGPRGQQITYWDGLTPWLIRAVERAHGIKE